MMIREARGEVMTGAILTSCFQFKEAVTPLSFPYRRQPAVCQDVLHKGVHVRNRIPKTRMPVQACPYVFVYVEVRPV